MQFLLAVTDGTIWNALRYRVAAPSIRIVPWAALASCWPLPQQLLPVSAAGGGRRRCTLGIISGKNILNFGFQESLRTFLKPIFTGGVVKENGICNAAFCESAALRLASSPSQALTRQIPPFVTCGDIFPRSGGSLSSKGEPLAKPYTSQFNRQLCRHAKVSPFGRGGCERSEQTERARTLSENKFL